MSETMETELAGYDWEEVFDYADGSAGAPVACLGEEGIDLAPFGLPDVARVIALVEGENDGPEWLALVELKDRRHAFVVAGCDYTGWG